jgi:GTPase SAR1 family protein
LIFRELPAAEEYEKMRQINYPQTDAFFILYSIDNPQSFQNALNLVKKFYFSKKGKKKHNFL